MSYPFTIDTEVTVSYIQNNQYDNEKKPSEHVFKLNPRLWFNTINSDTYKQFDLDDPLMVEKLNHIVRVYYRMALNRIRTYVKHEDKDSVFVRRLDEKSLEIVINDKVNEGDIDDGKQTYDDICAHFGLVFELFNRVDKLYVVPTHNFGNSGEEEKHLIGRVMNEALYNKFGVQTDRSGKQTSTTLPFNVHAGLTLNSVHHFHFVGCYNPYKKDNQLYYIILDEYEDVEVEGITYLSKLDRTKDPLDLNKQLGNGLPFNHDESMPIDSVAFVDRVIVNNTDIDADFISYDDGSMKQLGWPHDENNLDCYFKLSGVFEKWNSIDVVIMKYIDAVLKEVAFNTTITGCEELFPEKPFTLKPDTLYSFNVNEQVLRVIEHELIRLNLPFVFVRSVCNDVDEDTLQYLIISEKIDRHLAYLQTYTTLNGVAGASIEDNLIQVEKLYQGSLGSELQVLGKGVLVDDTNTAISLSNVLYGILKGVYI